MKRLALRMAVVASGLLLAWVAAAFEGTYTPGIGINQTPHDIPHALGVFYPPYQRDGTTPDNLNRICIYCHAPHNTYRVSSATGGSGPLAPDTAFDYLPLWNHTLQDLNPPYSTYEAGPGAPQSGPKATQALETTTGPSGTSLLCLSCHDGSIAVNSYGNQDQPGSSHSTGTDHMVNAYSVGKDRYLGNHHPISFDYDDVQSADQDIRNADNFQMTRGLTIRDYLYGGAKMECATCHSVHNKGNAGEKLLWRSDQNSELCLTCHDKGRYTPP